MDIISILNDMITSGLGLSLVGGAFVLWWLSGKIPNLFSPKPWDWKRGLEDLCKALLMGVLLVAGTGLLNLGGQFFAMLGWDITEATQDVSTYVLAGAMAWGFVNYMSKALKNGWRFFNLVKSELKGDKAKFDEGVAEIGEGVRDFIDTITGKTSKEDIESTILSSDDPILDYEEVEEGGKGGVNNTYPEPYRSAAQDSMTDPSTCYNRECVSYCAWKIKELTGKWLTRTGGMNAKYWVARLRENGYGTIVSRPQDTGKYIGVSTAGQYGHVVWFEEGTTISEYNYLYRGGFSVRNINLSAYIWVQIKAPTTDKVDTDHQNSDPRKSDQEIADEVIAGKWGNDPERTAKLKAAGYNRDTIQAIVNAKSAPKTQPAAAPKRNKIEVGSIVVPTKLVDYTGHRLVQYDPSYTVTQLTGDRAVLTARGSTWAAMNVRDLKLA